MPNGRRRRYQAKHSTTNVRAHRSIARARQQGRKLTMPRATTQRRGLAGFIRRVFTPQTAAARRQLGR